MLSEMFWDFQKTLIYKEKCKQSKNKERKKLYHKSATKVFQVCMIIVYDSFFLALVLLALVLALHCYCGENVKYFQNNCFKEYDNMAVEKISQ